MDMLFNASLIGFVKERIGFSSFGRIEDARIVQSQNIKDLAKGEEGREEDSQTELKQQGEFSKKQSRTAEQHYRDI